MRSQTVHGERFRGLRSSGVLDIIQPRPSLSPDIISRPIRHGSRHTHPTSHVRQCSRGEVDLRSSSRHIRSHSPRFGSVVHREAPRYSTLVHNTIMSGDTTNSSAYDTLHIISNADVPVPDTPPPVYSRFDPGLPMNS